MYTALCGLCPRRPGAHFTLQEHQRDVAGPGGGMGLQGGGSAGPPASAHRPPPIPSHPIHGPFCPGLCLITRNIKITSLSAVGGKARASRPLSRHLCRSSQSSSRPESGAVLTWAPSGEQTDASREGRHLPKSQLYRPESGAPAPHLRGQGKQEPRHASAFSCLQSPAPSFQSMV